MGTRFTASDGRVFQLLIKRSNGDLMLGDKVMNDMLSPPVGIETVVNDWTSGGKPLSDEVFRNRMLNSHAAFLCDEWAGDYFSIEPVMGPRDKDVYKVTFYESRL